MKKVFLSVVFVLALSISFVSCKKTQDAEVDAEGTEVAETPEEETVELETPAEEETVEASSDVPNFEDEAVQEYVNAYDAYVKEYAAAVESKDMNAFTALSTKGQELGTKSAEIAGKLSAEDAQKLTEYMTAKSKELQELTAKMTAQ